MLLKDYVSPSIRNKILTQVLDAQQVKHNEINNNIQDTINQGFIMKATWSLPDWEEEFGVKPKLNDTLENRRNRVMAKKRGIRTTTKEVVKEICGMFAENVDVIEYSKDYWFEMDLETHHGFTNFLDVLIEIIEELKPAHLGVRYKLASIKEYQSTQYAASTLVSTFEYTLTSDFSEIYNSNSSEKLASTAVNTHIYTLTNDISITDESMAEANQASTQSIALNYELS